MYNETWELIQSLEADGLPSDHEVFDILEEKLAERIERYYELLGKKYDLLKIAAIADICNN